MYKVIIPAAGIGSRMSYLSKNRSKCLIPINGKPVLEHIFSSIKLQMFKDDYEIWIVQRYGVQDISEYVQTLDKELQEKIHIITQHYSKGPGGAVMEALEAIYNVSDMKFSKENQSYKIENILIWLSDTICTKFNFDYSRSFFGVKKVEPATYSRWCLIDPENNFYDKPDSSKIYNLRAVKNIPNEDNLSALVGLYFIKEAKMKYHFYMPDFMGEVYPYELQKIFEVCLESWKLENKNTKFELEDVENTWHDCGELETFYRSSADLINNLSRNSTYLKADFDIGSVTKTALTKDAENKLLDEYIWYTKHDNVYRKLCTPKIVESNFDKCLQKNFYYAMSLETGSTLSDMFLYENIKYEGWEFIMRKLLTLYKKACYDFSNFKSSGVYQHDMSDMINEFYSKKSKERLAKNLDYYSMLDKNFDINYWNKFIDLVCTKYAVYLSVYGNRSIFYKTNVLNVHGDFHFGNILFDTIKSKFIFLDPRGDCFAYNEFTGVEIVDSLYDIAKLYQDIYCGYSILLNNRKISQYEDKMAELELIMQHEIQDIEYIKIAKSLSIILLLTCVPFHKDDWERCRRFVYRAKKLAREINL